MRYQIIDSSEHGDAQREINALADEGWALLSFHVTVVGTNRRYTAALQKS